MLTGVLGAMTIYALVLIFRGRPLGKDSPDKPIAAYRWMGAFLLTSGPVIVVAMGLTMAVFALNNPQLTIEEAQSESFWYQIATAGVFLALYIVIASLWEKGIKNRAMSQQATP